MDGDTLCRAIPTRRTPDLENPDATGLRITRGGGWAANRKMVRCAYRGRFYPGYRNYGFGFRLARTLSLAVVFCPLSAVP